MARDQRRLTAIVSTDVAGYSRLMGRDESGTLAALKAHLRELIDPKVAEYGGRTVKSMGDGLLLEFPSVVDAVRCAVDVQRGMRERNAGVAPETQIRLRIGINVGDIIIDGDDIFGDGVNVAARLQGLADPGGICVSRVVRDQVLDKLGFAFDDLGQKEVKNIARPVEVFRVAFDAAAGVAAAPSSPPRRSRIARAPRIALAAVLFALAGAHYVLAMAYALDGDIAGARAEAGEVRRLLPGRRFEADRMRAEADTPVRKAFVEGKVIPALGKAGLLD